MLLPLFLLLLLLLLPHHCDYCFRVAVFQVEAAVIQALLHQASTMVTRELATEVVYCLGPTRSLNHALSTFSLKSSSTGVMFVVLHHDRGAVVSEQQLVERCLADISTLVKGESVSLTQGGYRATVDGASEAVVADLYGLTATELERVHACDDPHGAFVDSLLTRMGARDLCRS